MKVLVTGGAGFIGRALSAELLRNDCEVTVLDNLSGSGRPPPGVSFIYGNVAEPDAWTFPGDFDLVYHLAASFANARSLARPHEDAHWNIVGTINAARFAARTGTRLIYTGSSSSYGVPEHTQSGDVSPFKESDKLRPVTPYAVSKKVGEEYTSMLAPNGWLIFRLFNVFGPGDVPGPYRNAIPNMTHMARTEKVVPVYGEGATRDFTHIGTVIRVLTESPRKIGHSGIFNICSGSEVRLLHVARHIAARYGARVAVEPPRYWDSVDRRRGDNTRLKQHFAWLSDQEFWNDLELTLHWLDEYERTSNAA
jgi:UDP-glucose 4-epimerase